MDHNLLQTEQVLRDVMFNFNLLDKFQVPINLIFYSFGSSEYFSKPLLLSCILFTGIQTNKQCDL